jgi:hypothetical protein
LRIRHGLKAKAERHERESDKVQSRHGAALAAAAIKGAATMQPSSACRPKTRYKLFNAKCGSLRARMAW